MIIIKDADFEMEQVKSTPFFNLKLPTIINEGKETQRTELKLDGYGMPFETCIQKIVSYKLSQTDTVYSIASYIDAYIKQSLEIMNLIEYDIPETNTEDTITVKDIEE